MNFSYLRLRFIFILKTVDHNSVLLIVYSEWGVNPRTGAFLMQNLNACVVTTAVPSPCGVFHCFTVEMNFGPVFQ